MKPIARAVGSFVFGMIFILSSRTAWAGCPPIPGAIDQFPSTAKVVIELFPPLPIGPPTVIRLGSAGLPDSIVQRAPQVGGEITTEMMQLELRGVSALAGRVVLHESPGFQSLGAITDIVQDPGTCQLTSGESFFDVFVHVDLPDLGGITLMNTVPFHVQRRIAALPPRNEPFENPVLNPVFLYQAPDFINPKGRILHVVHQANPKFPPGEVDCFQTTLRSFVEIFPPFFPGGYNGIISSQGPAQVRRSNPFDPGSGLDTIQTEILSMNLTGFDPALGNFNIQTNAPNQSLGTAQENPDPTRTYPADSSFNVFVKINTQALGPLQTKPPQGNQIVAQLQLVTVPPGVGDAYQSPALAPPAPLFDAAGVTQIGRLSQVNHVLGEYQSWQPPPPAGSDCFDSWVTLRLTIFPPYFPGGCTETLMIGGPFKIFRGNPTNTGPLLLDSIQTLMACARFTGPSICAGALTARLSPTIASSGSIKSLAPAENFPADSFFDVFFEIDTNLGTLHNSSPSHMQTTINKVPPDDGEIYYGPGTIIPIYDESGIQIGEILEVSHEIHQSISCLNACDPLIKFPSKNRLNLGPGGMGANDLLRRDLGALRSSLGNFNPAICISNDGSAVVSDPATPVVGGAGFAYIARHDSALTPPESYSSGDGPGLIGNRDLTAVACP